MELAKEKKSAFFVTFILFERNFFNICFFISMYRFENMYTFTYQKTLFRTLFRLFCKLSKIFSVSLSTQVPKCPRSAQVSSEYHSTPVESFECSREIQAGLDFELSAKNIPLKCLLSDNHKFLANSMIYFILCLCNIFRGREKDIKIFLHINNTLTFSDRRLSWICSYPRLFFKFIFLSKMVILELSS